VKEVVDALEAQDLEMRGLLVDLDEEGWSRPTPCEGWDVADVVLHVAQSNELAIGALSQGTDGWEERRSDVIGDATDADSLADLTVQRERGAPPSAVFERWWSAAEGQRAGLAALDPKDRVPWIIGDLPARTLATTRLSETWIHTTDVARALGVDLAPTDRLWHIARLAWRTVPYAFARAGRELAGPVSFELVGPGGETWNFREDGAATVVRGDALDLCMVAARRRDAAESALRAEGIDAAGVLELIRTYA
jgi:uncharacterized protein (TIGR03084 family)